MFHNTNIFVNFLLTCLCVLCLHTVCVADETADVENAQDETVEQSEENVSSQETEEMQRILSTMQELDWDSGDNAQRQELYKKIEQLSKRADELTQQATEEAKEKLDQAKETEQSFANRMLGGVTTAAVGLGSMQLAQGLAEKQADSAANKDMNAYIASMYCLIGNDYKSSRVELNEKVNIPQPTREFTNNRSEYLSLANELKTLKSALGLKAGIESEVVVDDLGLYQNTNKGITDGAYASRYRANAQNDEDDKAELKKESKTTKTRMIVGGVVAGAGMLAGMVGNALINNNNKSTSSNTKAERDKVKAELQRYMDEEIKKCNTKIQQHKNLAKKIKNNSDIMQISEYQQYVKDVEAMQLMPDDADITDFKGHKVCY